MAEPWKAQARDKLGRWVAQNKGTLLTKAIATAAGLGGGAMAGPVGAAAGQAIGSIVARPALALGEAMMSGEDGAVFNELMDMGRDLSAARDRAAEALQKVDLNSLEDVLSKDLIGWAVAHGADYGIDHLIPGASAVPGVGGAAAALTTGTLHKAKTRAKRLYESRQRADGSGLAPATVPIKA